LVYESSSGQLRALPKQHACHYTKPSSKANLHV